ncbi:PIN domain-containing protein [Candidatus Parcubacteria bacterium]|nr:MAG: PIN domain-containing protein [Candidatus Parcubacteria bacterium]
MRIYLDVCAIQRPLDTPSHLRIAIEAEAVLGVLALCENGKIEIVSSDALVYETNRNPHPMRREYALAVLALAKEHLEISEEVEQRAAELVEQGFKALDALHLALAEAGRVDYFCTSDDKLLKRARRLGGILVKVVSPLELAEEVEK